MQSLNSKWFIEDITYLVSCSFYIPPLTTLQNLPTAMWILNILLLEEKKMSFKNVSSNLLKCPSEVCSVQKPLPPYPSTIGAFPIWLSQYQHIILCYCHLWFLFYIISIIVCSFCFLKFRSFYFFCKYSIYCLPSKEI